MHAHRFAVHRAPRADGSEAMLLHAPMAISTSASVAVGLMKHAIGRDYWVHSPLLFLLTSFNLCESESYSRFISTAGYVTFHQPFFTILFFVVSLNFSESESNLRFIHTHTHTHTHTHAHAHSHTHTHTHTHSLTHTHTHTQQARNLILLLTPDLELGVEAFLQAYVGGYPLGTGGVYPESVAKQRAGSIHSGLSLQLNLGTFRAVTVRTAGINGRKPNLDFVQCALSL